MRSSTRGPDSRQPAWQRLKFTPSGGQISITARSEHDEVQINVADTGVGIHENELPRLFERFWQARASGGVGLGLSIVKALVEVQGGRVTVKSKLGRGSTFSFTLPVRQLSIAPPDGVMATVLVVDDDADTRISVADVLEEAGYRALTANDGIEALELLRRERQLRPSVILLDLKMPKMDAREFRREQQSDPDSRTLL